ncbi:MAG: YciI family protein [Alphaproteobacteria bacterium]
MTDTLAQRRAKLPRHQFYVVMTRMAQPTGDAMAVLQPLLTAHLDWLNDLEARSILFAAGPLREPDGPMTGEGMFVLRAASLAAARALAAAEPFHAAGVRTFDLFPWQVNEGGFQLTVKFTDSSVTFR